MDKSKKINLTLVAISASVLVGVFSFWNLQCTQGICDYALRNGFLRPLMQASIFLSIITGILLLLPSHYFQTWLKKIFSWAFPLSLILVLTTEDSTSILAFSRTLVVQILGTLFGIVTAFFVLHRFLKLRKEKKNSKI